MFVPFLEYILKSIFIKPFDKNIKVDLLINVTKQNGYKYKIKDWMVCFQLFSLFKIAINRSFYYFFSFKQITWFKNSLFFGQKEKRSEKNVIKKNALFCWILPLQFDNSLHIMFL